MVDTLFSPFEFQFMINAFLIALIISVPTSLFSCYLILKGWALMGDAISHAVLPGIVLAYIFGLPLLLGAFCAGMVCALSTGFFSRNSRVKEDTILGIVFSGMFGLGLVLYTKFETDIHLDHILFGNILGITAIDFLITVPLATIVTLILVLKRSDLLLNSFDSVQAQVSGLNTFILHYGLLIMLSATIVSTLSSVGIILAVGLLIVPGAIAFLISNQFRIMSVIALVITLFSSFAGVYLSFFFDSAPAPTIIMIFSAIFILAFAFSQIKDYIFKNYK